MQYISLTSLKCVPDGQYRCTFMKLTIWCVRVTFVCEFLPRDRSADVVSADSRTGNKDVLIRLLISVYKLQDTMHLVSLHIAGPLFIA